jgi:flagella basal body P-ring formation protein FlgA
MKVGNFLIFFYALIVAPYAIADKIMDTEQITQQTIGFLKGALSRQLPTDELAGVKISIRKIDPRLRLEYCDKTLAFKLQSPEIGRNTSVKVSCNRDRPWSIYVGATIALERPVITVTRELPRKHILTEDDLISLRRDVYSLRGGYSVDANDLIGQELKRALRSGDVVYNYQLQAPDIIKKGDKVTVITRRGSLSVMSDGIAMGDASKGEKVRVENERSSRIIQARVTGPGTVEVL